MRKFTFPRCLYLFMRDELGAGLIGELHPALDFAYLPFLPLYDFLKGMTDEIGH
jgi:hypothetical protein